MPLVAVKCFRGISSGGKPPFVIPRRLTVPRSRRKYGLNGYFATQARQLFLTSASKLLSECLRIGRSERMRIIVRINGNFQITAATRCRGRLTASARLPQLKSSSAFCRRPDTCSAVRPSVKLGMTGSMPRPRCFPFSVESRSIFTWTTRPRW